ncbi:MAG: HAMP domain-containing sensor histidine kinase [Ramlibacter sp.]
MMHNFLSNNRDELISRCKLKVAQRPKREATEAQLVNGVPLFLDQLIKTLEAEEVDDTATSLRISGASGGDSVALSELGVSASAHGKQLLVLGYTVDQVVHDYGDLCQAVTELAFERDAPFAIEEFRTLNRCLDNAIADAVTEFSYQRDLSVERMRLSAGNARLGFLMHEVRNGLNTVTLAVNAMDRGNLPMAGATGEVLKRTLASLNALVGKSLEEVREGADVKEEHPTFSTASFISDAKSSAALTASAKGCKFTVSAVDPLLGMKGNRDLLLGALANLLHNAFKFTHAHTEVTLKAYAIGDRIHLDVEDNCGGLPKGDLERLFTPFIQRSDDKTGLGLGLSIARQNVEADEGLLTVRDLPGKGCIFTMSMPRHSMPVLLH